MDSILWFFQCVKYGMFQCMDLSHRCDRTEVKDMERA